MSRLSEVIKGFQDKSFIRSRIARRLIVSVVLFSSLITLVISAIQLYSDYDQKIGNIKNGFDEVVTANLETLVTSVWVFDEDQINNVLKGIASRPEMELVEISIKGNVKWKTGRLLSDNTITYTSPLVTNYRDNQVQIAELKLIAGLDRVYEELLASVAFILVSNGLKTFLVAGFMLMLVYFVITRHLSKIVNYISSHDIEEPIAPLTLDKKRKNKTEPDELDELVNAINDMNTKLADSYQQLRNSEIRFKTIAQATPVGIFQTNPQGKCIFSNKKWQDIAGLSEEDALGDGWADTLHPDDKERIFAEWSKSVEEKRPFSLEYRYLRPDGKVTWVYGQAEAEYDQKGVIKSYIGTITDISDIKQTEAEIQRLASIVKSSDDFIGISDIEGHALFLNEAGRELVGIRDDEHFYSTMIHDYFLDEDREMVVNTIIPQLMDSGRWAGEINFRNFQTEERIPVWFDIFRIDDPSSGKPINFATVTRDIREQKKVEGILSRFKGTLDMTLDCVFMFEPDTLRFFYVNTGAKLQIGCSEEELLQMTPVDIKPEYDEAAFREVLKPLIEGSIPVLQFETIHRHKDGADIPVEITLQYICPVNEKPRFVAIVRDIAERKKAEYELDKHREHLEEMVDERTHELETVHNELVRKERLATLGQLTATVSHELRNPLAAMRPSLYIIKKQMDQKDERTQKAIERLDRSITRCDHIIDELLDFTRITDIALEPVILDEWLQGLIAEQAMHPDIQVTQTFGLGDERANIDISRLSRALINVIENACHAMQEGDDPSKIKPGAQLTIETKVTGERIEIGVKDTGTGIAKDVLPKIFEPLYSTKSFGVGLGMSVVKQIMEQHGGGVEITSEPDEGVLVVLWLPVRHENPDIVNDSSQISVSS